MAKSSQEVLHYRTSPRVVAYDRVYVWELPVRLFHWLNATCITVLVATGYLIGNPQAIFYANEPYQQYWFGTVRFLHFATAFIFFFNYLVRVYWAFAGNRYARWNTFLPLKKEQWQRLMEIISVDILQLRLRRVMRRGHNILASISYLVLFLAFLFQSATGFALYSSMSSSWLPKLFTWVIPLMGGDMAVRQWHHMAMWAFIIFTIIHIYIVFYHDYVEGRGTTSSMISGWEFERKDGSE